MRARIRACVCVCSHASGCIFKLIFTKISAMQLGTRIATSRSVSVKIGYQLLVSYMYVVNSLQTFMVFALHCVRWTENSSRQFTRNWSRKSAWWLHFLSVAKCCGRFHILYICRTASRMSKWMCTVFHVHTSLKIVEKHCPNENKTVNRTAEKCDGQRFTSEIKP
jgi:hypothetical protein